MLQRGTPVYNIINSIWQNPIPLSEKIQVVDSIEKQMPEIVRKEYRKWKFLQMDRNEVLSLADNLRREINDAQFRICKMLIAYAQQTVT